MYCKILFDMHYLFVMGFSNNLSWKTQANMIWKCESKSFTFLEKFSFWNHINEHRKYRDRDKNWRIRRDELINKAKIQHSIIWRWKVELEKKKHGKQSPLRNERNKEHTVHGVNLNSDMFTIRCKPPNKRQW